MRAIYRTGGRTRIQRGEHQARDVREIYTSDGLLLSLDWYWPPLAFTSADMVHDQWSYLARCIERLTLRVMLTWSLCQQPAYGTHVSCNTTPPGLM